MSIAVVWIAIGVLLILSELMATSIVAVFFGVAAIVVGLLVQFGWIESGSMQFLFFSIISLALLFTARGRCKRWFVGHTIENNPQPSSLRHDIGNRVIAHSDFTQGTGRVILNGVQWSARSDDPLKAGDVAWVVDNDGINLRVSAVKPS